MNWNQSRLSYYADFLLAPLIALAALATEMRTSGATVALGVAVLIGAVLWTFAEYWIHRSLFHRVFHHGHGLHHRKPAAYVAAPTWLTGIAHVAALGLMVLALGHTFGIGLFIGVEAGYLSYIIVHDRIHHGAPGATGWLARRRALHMMHHRGAHVNFGVGCNVWDRVFGTFRTLTLP